MYANVRKKCAEMRKKILENFVFMWYYVFKLKARAHKSPLASDLNVPLKSNTNFFKNF